MVDPDAIARAINPTDPASAATRAGKRSLELRNELLRRSQSFVVETTLSGMSTLTLIEEAKSVGFQIQLKFVGLSDVELSKARVAARFAYGGHNVPAEDIELRFSRSLENLPAAISKSGHIELYDNSGKDPYRLVADIALDRAHFVNAPKWATDAVFEAAQDDLSKARTVDDLKRATDRALEAAAAAGVTSDQIQREMKNLERVQERKKDREGHDL